MKQTIKTQEIIRAYEMLGRARFTTLADGDKIQVWKIARALKPAAMKIVDARNDAIRQFVPEDMQKRLAIATKFENDLKAGLKTDITIDEYNNIIDDADSSNELVCKALEETLPSEMEVEFDSISDDAFALLTAENGWTIQTAMTLEFICNK